LNDFYNAWIGLHIVITERDDFGLLFSRKLIS